MSTNLESNQAGDPRQQQQPISRLQQHGRRGPAPRLCACVPASIDGRWDGCDTFKRWDSCYMLFEQRNISAVANAPAALLCWCWTALKVKASRPKKNLLWPTWTRRQHEIRVLGPIMSAHWRACGMPMGRGAGAHAPCGQTQRRYGCLQAWPDLWWFHPFPTPKPTPLPAM